MKKTKETEDYEKKVTIVAQSNYLWIHTHLSTGETFALTRTSKMAATDDRDT